MEAGGLYIGTDQVIGVVHRGEGLALWYAHLRRKGDKVDQLAFGEAADVPALVKAVGTRVPWVVVFDGLNVVHRVVHAAGSAQDALAAAFPNAPMDQLLVSGHTSGEHHGFSMIRADRSTPVRSAMQAVGARVVDLFVGPWNLLELAPLVDATSFHQGIGGHCFILADQALVEHHRTEIPPGLRRIGDVEIAEEATLAWAAAWAYLVPSVHRVAPLGDPCAADRVQERARVRYERVLLGTAACILLLLAVDIGLRWSTDATGAAQATARDQHTAALAEVAALQEQVAERASLLAQLGAAQQGALAERMALLLADVPLGIRLDRVQVEPLVTPLREREPMELHAGRTLLEGTCGDAGLLNTWGERPATRTTFRLGTHDRFWRHTR